MEAMCSETLEKFSQTQGERNRLRKQFSLGWGCTIWKKEGESEGI